MKAALILGLCTAAILMISFADLSSAEEMYPDDMPQERGYCAENGIKCNDIQCCGNLKCRCNPGRTNCVCTKK
nr:Ot_66 precursor [Oxyopes takobius]